MAARPSDVKYTPTHEWIRVQGAEATVGITDFAIEHLGDLVFVELPEKGKKLKAGESAAEVESVKAVGEVYAPIAGEVTAVNAGLANDQAPLSVDPYQKGWLFKMKIDPKTAAGARLLDLGAYEKQLATQGEPH
jgi:glycine cleavage system H protein